MPRWTVSALIALLTLSQVSWGFEFMAKSETGKVLVYQNSSGEWYTIPDSLNIDIGDSLFVDEGQTGIAQLGAGCEIKLNGPCRLSLGGQLAAPVVYLKQGEIIFKRTATAEVSMVTIRARGASLTPMGTIAAVKFTKMGEPTVAVVEGQMRMESNSGQAIVVGEGAFGTLDVNNAFKQGKLSPAAIRNLERAAGLREDADEPVAETEADDAEQMQTAQVTEPEQGSGGNEQGASGGDAEPQMVQASLSPEQEISSESEPAEEVQEETAPEQESVSSPAAQESKPGVSEQQDSAQPEESGAKPEKKSKKSVAKKSTVGSGASVNDATKETVGEETKEAGGNDADEDQPASAPDKPSYSMSAGPVTVDDAQWTRIAFMLDIPIWKFGIGLDIELFMNDQGQFDSKGWEFTKDNWVETLTRKIRYLRFAHENDPVFAKVGGLDNVTFSHGLIVDRFRNTMFYPDEKLLGVQFYLNDLSPIGITLQTMTGDLLDFRRDGGVAAARLALKPLKPSEIPVLGNLDIGAMYATDLNQYAPVRDWELKLQGDQWDRDRDGVTDSTFLYSIFGGSGYYDAMRQDAISKGEYDTIIEHQLKKYQSYEDGFAILGFDATLPIITSKLVGLDLYGQLGINMDPKDPDDDTDTKGWGIGAPGVGLRVGPITASLEYRHTEENFEPGYFGPYYYDQRIELYEDEDSIATKEDRIEPANLNGLYGRLGFNIANVLVITGTYQGLIGEKDPNESLAPLDQRFEATAQFGEMLISKIPRVNKAEAYIWKTDIMRYFIEERGEYDNFFTPTPKMFYGYRIGFEVMEGAGLVWDSRYTFEFNEDGKPRQKISNVGIQASLTF